MNIENIFEGISKPIIKIRIRHKHPIPRLSTDRLFHYQLLKLIIIAKLALYNRVLLEINEMRKIFAIIGALIGGGLGIAVLGSTSQAANAALSQN
jgi:hypothetical protein